MITEDYVSFEVAKLLKEKGFVGECSRFYMPNGHGRWKYEHYHDFDISKRIECPTLQMACKWLREEYNILIVVDKGVSFYTWQLENNTTGEYIKDIIGEVSTYEEAVEAACLYVLKNLI